LPKRTSRAESLSGCIILGLGHAFLCRNRLRESGLSVHITAKGKSMRAGRISVFLVVAAAVVAAALWSASEPRPALWTEPGRRLRQRPLGIRRRSLRLLPRPDWTIRQAEARRRSVAVFAFWNVPTSELSQDKVDGIGLWKVSDLANALLSGVSPNGAHYYPSFPYPSYAKMTVADVRDLMAYLRTPPCYSASGALSDSGRSCISIANRLITIRAAETPGTVGSILSKH
jgi:hypothetical protein